MQNVEIVTGYTTGVIGRVTELHAQYYSRKWNFDHFFEMKVATELSKFIKHYNGEKDCIWSFHSNCKIEGAVSIHTSHDDSTTAHLRWFIMSKRIKGCGIGNQLMEEVIAFCRNASYKTIILWTFEGLDTAKHLYEKYGFKISKEVVGSRWGTTVTEQCYQLRITATT